MLQQDTPGLTLLICSDSHGDGALLAALIRREQPDALLHLGDCYADTAALPRLFPHTALYQVSGNNDFTGEAPAELQLTLGGKRLLLTHGHHYRVKSGPYALSLRAQELGVDAVLFGHTHQPLLDVQNGLWLVNPGSASRLLYQPQATYAVMRIAGDTIRCDIRTVPPAL